MQPRVIQGDLFGVDDKTFVVSSDYGCLALIDPKAYDSFVSENWELEQLLAHFVSQSNQSRMVAWGCVSGNWRVEIVWGNTNLSGYLEFSSQIVSSGQLLLTTYDDLTMAAQFEDVSLPEPHAAEYQFDVAAGEYCVRVVQIFDPAQAETPEVFDGTEPHYRIELTESTGPAKEISEVAWFAKVNHL